MNKSKTSLFLMEMILSVLIFSISVAICVKVFMKAYNISYSTKELNMAVTRCTSAAELFYGFSGDLSQIQMEMDADHSGISDKGSLTLFYNGKYDKCSEKDAEYYMLLVNHKDEDILTCDITMCKYNNDEVIYSLSLDMYTGGTVPVQNVPEQSEDGAMGGVL